MCFFRKKEKKNLLSQHLPWLNNLNVKDIEAIYYECNNSSLSASLYDLETVFQILPVNFPSFIEKLKKTELTLSNTPRDPEGYTETFDFVLKDKTVYSLSVYNSTFRDNSTDFKLQLPSVPTIVYGNKFQSQVCYMARLKKHDEIIPIETLSVGSFLDSIIFKQNSDVKEDELSSYTLDFESLGKIHIDSQNSFHDNLRTYTIINGKSFQELINSKQKI